ncbi:MAG: hypothetical protein ACJ8AK_15340 [Gemmatimonadaceae bacterium]
MKLQPRSVVFGTLFLGGLLLIAWQEYYRKSEMLSAIGLPGQRGNTHRHCDGVYSHPRWRVLPRGLITCRGLGSRSDFAMVGVDALTRQVIVAGRGWPAFDSVNWAWERDSTEQQLRLRGGHEFKCLYAPELNPPSTMKYWRFNGFFVRENAYARPAPYVVPWQLTLSASTTQPEECLRPPASRDPEESNPCVGARIIVPIGFGKAICWKAPPWA